MLIVDVRPEYLEMIPPDKNLVDFIVDCLRAEGFDVSRKTKQNRRLKPVEHKKGIISLDNEDSIRNYIKDQKISQSIFFENLISKYRSSTVS